MQLQCFSSESLQASAFTQKCPRLLCACSVPQDTEGKGDRDKYLS